MCVAAPHRGRPWTSSASGIVSVLLLSAFACSDDDSPLPFGPSSTELDAAADSPTDASPLSSEGSRTTSPTTRPRASAVSSRGGRCFASWGATTSCAIWKRFARRSTSPCSTSWAPLTARASDPGGEGIFQLLGGGGGGGDGGDVAFNSVSCSDDTFEPPTLAELESLKAEFEAVSPLFAQGYLEGAATCAGWPATPDPVASPIALDAPPLLVIGGIMDARTPYEWSVAMTEALGNATLLTSNHYGHVAFGQGSDCVRLAIRAYLASGSLPATGATCPP